MRALLRRPSVWIGLAVVLAAGVILAVRARGPVTATAIASRTDVEQHVVASGRVWVVTRVQISAQTAGRVVAVPAIEGRRVRAGHLLVQLDEAEARAAVAQARAAVSQAAARVEQRRRVGAVVASEALREAEANLVRAEADLARAEKLAAAGAVSAADLEEARRAAQVARAQRAAATAQQEAAAPDGAESRIAVSALRESQAQLSAAEARLEQLRIVARQDGVILTRAVEPGDVVQPGTTLLEMAADGETQLVIEPDERHLAWIRHGHRARVSADAYPGEIFDAEVSYIAPSIDPQRGSVAVRLRVPDPPPFLRPDMTVSVDLTVAAKRNVLAVPSEAVRGAATHAPWVLIVDGGRIATRRVALGIRGEGVTEILDGLEEGAEVVLESERLLADGQRVRAVPRAR
jgi:HlyD family secretion protein